MSVDKPRQWSNHWTVIDTMAKADRLPPAPAGPDHRMAGRLSGSKTASVSGANIET